jgi:hypothetical protein
VTGHESGEIRYLGDLDTIHVLVGDDSTVHVVIDDMEWSGLDPDLAQVLATRLRDAAQELYSREKLAT